MNEYEVLSVRGCLELKIYRGNDLIERYENRNMVMNLAREALAKLLGGEGEGKSVSEIGFGTEGLGPDPGDTSLKNSYTKEVAEVDYPESGHVRFSWTLASGEANGMTIKEFGLLASDGTLIARKTRGAIEKSDDISIDGAWTIIF